MRRAAAAAAALLAVVPLAFVVATLVAPGLDHMAQDRMLADGAAAQAAWRAASWPGDTWVGLAAAALAALACALVQARRAALAIAGAALGQVAAVQGLKLLLARRRPTEGVFEVVDGFAFPSGHSSTAVAVYGLVVLIAMPALLRGRSAPLVQRLALGAWLGLAAAIGVARVAGGAHYPADVVAGWAVGGAAVALAVMAASPQPRSSPSRPHVPE